MKVARPSDAFRAYAVAALGIVAAIVVRALLDPWLGDFVPLVTLYGAVALAVWQGGWLPGVAAAVIGYLACDYFFIEPRYTLGLASLRDFMAFSLYYTACALIVALGDNMRRSRARVERARAELEREVALRRDVEGQHAAALARLDSLVANAPAGIALFDKDLRFVRVNEHLAMLNGVSVERHIGRKVGEIVPSVAPPIDAILARVRDTGEVIRGVEVSGETPAQPGRTRHWLTNYYPVRDASGELFGVGGVVLDVTAMRAAQQALRDADRRKDEFLATLAHELRNPLGAIGNAVALMRMPAAPKRTVDDARDIVDRQVTHLVRLVDDLLDVSRVGSGKLRFRRERVAVGTVVARAVEAVRPLIEASGHELTVALAPSWMVVDGDCTRLVQVVQNLLANAARYTPPGGHVVVTAAPQGGDVVVSVEDDGAGIAPDVLPRLFELFWQARDTVDRGSGGLGIGLALARRLTELHGGTIEARSDGAGHGAEFIVRLPASAALNCAGAIAHARGEPRRVLVVQGREDESAQRLTATLRSRGDDVHIVHDGSAGVAAADALKPDVVLLDLGFDGHEACRRIRDEPWGRRICVVARSRPTDPRTDAGRRAADAPFCELDSLIERLVSQAAA